MTGVTKFKLEGLLEYLHHRRFAGQTRAHIIQMIRDMGGDNGVQHITKRKGSGQRYDVGRFLLLKKMKPNCL